MNYHKIIDNCYNCSTDRFDRLDTIVINNLREAILLFDDFKYAKAETCLSECIKYIEINGVRFKRIEEND